MDISTTLIKDEILLDTIKSHGLPAYLTTSFEFENAEEAISIFSNYKEGYVYSRYGNPTINAVANKIASLEAFGSGKEGFAILTGSGMSAISTVAFGTLKAGQSILTHPGLYGGTLELFRKIISKFGINIITANFSTEEETISILENNPSIGLVYLETPSNPTLYCVDIAAVCKIANRYAVLTVVDNTFCTAMIQQPFVLGADIVIHSTTKFLNGHGNAIGGAIICHDPELMKNKLWPAMKLVGTNPSAFDAWLLNQGLKTLHLRMEKQFQNAQLIAQYLNSHSKVKSVNHLDLSSHPSYSIAKKQMKNGGPMLSFEIDGGTDMAIKWINALKLISHAPTLGDVDTLVLHPATSSHIALSKQERMEANIPDGLIRISSGIESSADLLEDISQALKQI